MTPDAKDDDPNVHRPPGQTPDPGFQKTEWAPGNAVPPTVAVEKTQIAGAPPAAPPSSPPAAAPDMGGNLPVGTRLGEFEITSLIGEGGFGIVYLAHDHSLQRRVALKEYMPSSLAARAGGSQVQVKSERHRETFQAGLKSFINEARLLASFDHPALVKVYRFWEANGTAYMVMPFLEGTTLKDVLRGMTQRPDESWLRSVLGPLTEALLVIHAEQCYHRDIAPDNVMLLPGSNRWLLLDFGAARRVIGDMTQALTVILKPGYAPVEQYAEIPGMKQGPWTDVYALAAVVYYAIMGKTPPPSVGRLLNDNYLPLVQGAAGRYSESFLAAIDRALVVRPEARTQSIGELRKELGLGAPSADPYTTQPLPVGTVPARAAVEPTVVLPSGPGAVPPPPVAPPVVSPVAPPRPQAVATPPLAAVAAPAPAKNTGKGAMVGIGVVVLGALAVGGYALMKPAAAPAPVVVAAGPAPATAPPPAASPAPAPALVPPPAALPATYDVATEFDRVLKAQTPGFGVRAVAAKTQLRIRRDELKFNLTSERDGYLYVYGHSSDGSLTLLVPNKRSGVVKLRKGQDWRFPTGDGFYLPADEPTGTSRLLLVVSAAPRSHEALKLKFEDPVYQFPGGDAASALMAQHSGPGSFLTGTPKCPAGVSCDDAYGAALLNFETVR